MLTILFYLALVVLTVYRFKINKKIYTSKGYEFKESGPLRYQNNIQEMRESGENNLFLLFCLFTFIWVGKGNLKLKSNIASFLTIFLVVLYVLL